MSVTRILAFEIVAYAGIEDAKQPMPVSTFEQRTMWATQKGRLVCDSNLLTKGIRIMVIMDALRLLVHTLAVLMINTHREAKESNPNA